MAGQKKPLPLEMVFVRHGESEANVLQSIEKKIRAQREETGVIDPALKQQASKLGKLIHARPDWEHRLTPRGQEQAIAAGEWIEKNIGTVATYFDARYHSPFIRAQETAALIGPDAGWRVHNMLYERDWGEFGVTPRHEQAEKFPYATMMKNKAPLFARLSGGAAIAETVTLQVDNFRDDLRERWSDGRVLAVAHGDTIKGGVRYVFEHMRPTEWHRMDADPAQNLGNCAILSYLRYDPENPCDVRDYAGWMRVVDPYQPERSPFGGEWQQIPYASELSGEQLMNEVELFPRLITDNFEY